MIALVKIQFSFPPKICEQNVKCYILTENEGSKNLSYLISPLNVTKTWKPIQ